MHQPKDYPLDVQARARIGYDEHKLPPRWFAYLILGIVIGVVLVLGFLTGFCS